MPSASSYTTNRISRTEAVQNNKQFDATIREKVELTKHIYAFACMTSSAAARRICVLKDMVSVDQVLATRMATHSEQ